VVDVEKGEGVIPKGDGLGAAALVEVNGDEDGAADWFTPKVLLPGVLEVPAKGEGEGTIPKGDGLGAAALPELNGDGLGAAD
jgi:hypothetical protein